MINDLAYFRFSYVKYDEQTAALSEHFKSHCETLEARMNAGLEEGREKSLALTKLEECFMWIGKSLRNSQIKRDKERARGQDPTGEFTLRR